MKTIRLNHLKHKHKHQKGIIIGGGPSLQDLVDNNYPFHKLEDEFIVIGCNKSYKVINSHYLIFLDIWFWKEFHHELKQINNTIIITKEDNRFKEKNLAIPTDYICVPTSRGIKYPLLNRDSIICNNVGSAALSLSEYLGLYEIYLFGIDVTSINNKHNFHEDYNHKSKIDKPYDNHYDNLEFIISNLKSKYNKKIYSCSKISRLNNKIDYIDPYSILPTIGR